MLKKRIMRAVHNFQDQEDKEVMMITSYQWITEHTISSLGAHGRCMIVKKKKQLGQKLLLRKCTEIGSVGSSFA